MNPPDKILETESCSQNVQKIFQVYLVGNKVYFGDIVFTLEIIENFRVLIFRFCLICVCFLTLWVGGSNRAQRKLSQKGFHKRGKYLALAPHRHPPSPSTPLPPGEPPSWDFQ